MAANPQNGVILHPYRPTLPSQNAFIHDLVLYLKSFSFGVDQAQLSPLKNKTYEILNQYISKGLEINENTLCKQRDPTSIYPKMLNFFAPAETPVDANLLRIASEIHKKNSFAEIIEYVHGENIKEEMFSSPIIRTALFRILSIMLIETVDRIDCRDLVERLFLYSTTVAYVPIGTGEECERFHLAAEKRYIFFLKHASEEDVKYTEEDADRHSSFNSSSSSSSFSSSSSPCVLAPPRDQNTSASVATSENETRLTNS